MRSSSTWPLDALPTIGRESVSLRRGWLPITSLRRSRSAEVMSKVVLLANDQEIKDPTILEQLRA